MFSEAFPILSSPDLPRLVAFYRDGLGFTETYRFPDEGEPQFVGLELGDGSQLGLGAQETATAPSGRFDLNVYATDCDAAVVRLRAAGGRVVSEPADMPWGERLARAEDPDGNRLVILTRLPGPAD